MFINTIKTAAATLAINEWTPNARQSRMTK